MTRIGISLLLLQLFTEITDDAKLDFTHDPGRDQYFMPEIMGAGGAFLDYDNDGDLDLYAVNGFITGPVEDDL